jgi:hypothetical protein
VVANKCIDQVDNERFLWLCRQATHSTRGGRPCGARREGSTSIYSQQSLEVRHQYHDDRTDKTVVLQNSPNRSARWTAIFSEAKR